MKETGLRRLTRREFFFGGFGLGFWLLGSEWVVVEGNGIPGEFARISFILYTETVKGLDGNLSPFVLATATTESGFRFNNIGDKTFANVEPKVVDVDKETEWQALKTIASWVGNNEKGVNNLSVEYGRVTGRLVKALGEIGCSDECAIGPKQFLPSTWVSEILKREKMWTSQEIYSFIRRLRVLEIIKREEVQELKDLNPIIFSEAFVMAMLYMQSCGIKVDGTNFTGWNNSGYQARAVVKRYEIIKTKFDIMAASRRLQRESEDAF